MTQKNREKLYKHFKDIENNYEAREGLNSGPTATSEVRKNAKESRLDLLKKHPELAGLDKPVKAEVETKSKGKK